MRRLGNAKRPGGLPGLSLATFVAGSLNEPDRCAGWPSVNAASHSGRAPCPWRDRPCHDVLPPRDGTLPRSRGVRQPYCARLSPFA